MNMEIILQRANNELDALNDGEGVLILTDAYGATPSNIACKLLEHAHANMVSGINLPMLMRVFNYFTEDLETLAHKAAEGGIRGIQLSPGENKHENTGNKDQKQAGSACPGSS